jgi:hypothetical protein
VKQFIGLYSKNIPIEFMPYNWSLNRTPDTIAGIYDEGIGSDPDAARFPNREFWGLVCHCPDA